MICLEMSLPVLEESGAISRFSALSFLRRGKIASKKDFGCKRSSLNSYKNKSEVK
jgi:hypothetical protein